MNLSEFVQQFLPVIDRADRMILCGHIRPDGDSVGVCVALAHTMVRMGKHPMIYFEGDLSRYPWLTEDPEVMEGIGVLRNLNDLSRSTMGRFTFVMLDLADPERSGEAAICIDLCETSVCIDHHVNHGEYADLNLIIPPATSASEVLYEVIKEAGWELDRISAMALFTGIAFDTGGFRHSSVTSRTFSAAAELSSYDLPITRIMNGLFHTRSFTEQRVLGHILGHAKRYHKDRIILAGMDKADFLKMGATANDCEGAVAMLSETEGTEVAIFMRELEPKEGQGGMKPQIRINLRSKQYVDVSEIAAKFGGGGHRRASGCTICEPMLLAKQMLLEAIEAQMDSLEGEDS